ncbi:MAG: reverse transcriptase domain-containing protein [Candidatus Thiodiazotropha endolucinida]|nr:hypothetical protein [Candidatus Thiodiazotropha taylori]MCW4264495.1 reverse transcriptase domain-containing protein [Candidatus Thiodiazotropha endolucinida]
MKYHVKNWEKITNDPWVLQSITGYRIEFDEQPVQYRVPNEIPFNQEQWAIVDNEVKELLKIGAIVPCESEKDEFISTIFIVPKPNGKFRPVINLRYLNEFIHYEHFKQESFSVVLDLLQEKDFLTSVDLQNAYFSIPVDFGSQKYLKFIWNGRLYKFVCVCFGISCAPFLFTKILKPVYAWFRQQGMRCSYYIDDSLNMNKDSAVCQSNTLTMVETLESLGFTVNYKKSSLIPSQRIVFFGFIIDTVEFKVFLTEEKVNKILLNAVNLLQKGRIIVRELASFIGLIVNAFYAIFEAPLHYRGMERNKLQGLGINMNYDNEMILSQESIEEIQWWVANVRSKNGKRIRPMKALKHCRTDASFQGWGCIDLDTNKFAQGRWTVVEADHSINYLELLAAFYALQSLYENTRGLHIEIQSDNQSCIKYINDLGGIVSQEMDLLAKDIWQWCLHREIYISASFCPGVLNTADFYSRNFSDSTEWMLKREIFVRLCKQFFMPDIDLFSSRLNNQVELFVTWFPEPGSFHSNAFSMSWHEYKPYLFPPFSLIGKVVNKVVEDQVEKAVLVFPHWKSQTWFPLLIDIVCSFPVRLPRHKDLLVLPHCNTFHPLCRSMRLVAVTISGRRCSVMEFRNQLHSLSSTPGDREPENSMVPPGNNGLFGTISGLAIPFKRLKL